MDKQLTKRLVYGSALVLVVFVLLGVAFEAGRRSMVPSGGGGDRAPVLQQESGTQQAAIKNLRSSDAASTLTQRNTTSILPLKTLAVPLDRLRDLTAMLSRLEEGDLTVVSDLAIAAPRFDEGELNAFLHVWAQQDPQAALKFATQSKHRLTKDEAASRVIEGWAAKDAAAAVAFCQQPQYAEQRRGWLVGAVRALAAEDLPWATAIATSMPLNQGRGKALRALSQRVWDRGGAQAASDWIEDLANQTNLDDPEVVSSAQRHALRSLARHAITSEGFDLQILESWAREQLREPYADPTTVAEVANTLHREPSESVAWLMELPANETRQQAIAYAMDRWADEFPNEAAKWLGDHLGSQEFDPILLAFATQIARHDPAAAMNWAGRANDSAERTEAQEIIHRRWQRSDPGAADAWVYESQALSR